jgi:hypothetical protein
MFLVFFERFSFSLYLIPDVSIQILLALFFIFANNFGLWNKLSIFYLKNGILVFIGD